MYIAKYYCSIFTTLMIEFHRSCRKLIQISVPFLSSHFDFTKYINLSLNHFSLIHLITGDIYYRRKESILIYFRIQIITKIRYNLKTKKLSSLNIFTSFSIFLYRFLTILSHQY